jgi:hypothetical protein
MQQAGLVSAGLIIVLLVAGFLLDRFGVDWGSWLSLLGGMIARVIAGVVFALTAMRAAQRGGIWFSALASILGLLAVFDFAILAVMTWGLVKFGPNPET